MGDTVIIEDEPKPKPDVIVVKEKPEPRPEKVVVEKTTVTETRRDQ